MSPSRDTCFCGSKQFSWLGLCWWISNILQSYILPRVYSASSWTQSSYLAPYLLYWERISLWSLILPVFVSAAEENTRDLLADLCDETTCRPLSRLSSHQIAADKYNLLLIVKRLLQKSESFIKEKRIFLPSTLMIHLFQWFENLLYCHCCQYSPETEKIEILKFISVNLSGKICLAALVNLLDLK